jgi:hypothetical protein
MLIYCWWECKLVLPFWKSVWRILKKVKIELPYDPVISLLGIYLKESVSIHNTDNCSSLFTMALFMIAKLWDQPRYHV